MNQIFRDIVYLADRGGTGFWRHTQQMMAINCIAQSLDIQYDCMQQPIFDENFYNGMTSVTCQRWISDQHKDIFCKFLKPLMERNHGWLVYAIDDNMSDHDIPKYNKGRAAFEGEKVQSNIETMLNTADFVVTTTDYIKQFYHRHYKVPLENILAVPNLLPKWWFGDRYDLDKKVSQFKQFKAKPRIGIISSLSHYNVENVKEDKDGKAVRQKIKEDGTKYWENEDGLEVNEVDTHIITDDIDDIVDCIRETVNDFQWVFFGYCPEKLADLVKANKIEVHGGCAILNYPSQLENLNLQAVVAPIKDIEFNRCKSHIKYMECAALGIPLFASNYLPYNRVMSSSQLFNSSKELTEMLTKLKFSSVGSYSDLITRQWKWLNTPCDEGDFHLNNYWLEDNLSIWINLLKLKQKAVAVSMQRFEENIIKAKEAEQKNTIFKNDNIQILK